MFLTYFVPLYICERSSINTLAFVSMFVLTMRTFIQGCMLHGTESGICSYRYLPDTYGGGLEGKEVANKEWKLGTDGACKNGDADHCMPFCGKWIGKIFL